MRDRFPVGATAEGIGLRPWICPECGKTWWRYVGEPAEEMCCLGHSPAPPGSMYVIRDEGVDPPTPEGEAAHLAWGARVQRGYQWWKDVWLQGIRRGHENAAQGHAPPKDPCAGVTCPKCGEDNPLLVRHLPLGPARSFVCSAIARTEELEHGEEFTAVMALHPCHHVWTVPSEPDAEESAP